MKKIAIISFVVILSSCGPSAEEKAKDQKIADSIAQTINEKQNECIDSLDKMLTSDTAIVAEK